MHEIEAGVDDAPVETQGRQRRSALVRCQRTAESLRARLPDLAKEREKLNRKAAEAVEAMRLAEARVHDDRAKFRAGLNTITGGAVERLLRVSNE